MNVIEQNLFGLLSRSAFDVPYSTVPMSAWKWHKLEQLAAAHGLWQWVRRGIVEYNSDKNLNLPFDFDYNLYNDDIRNEDETDALITQYNQFIVSRHKKIIENEHRSPNTAVDTLHLLAIIVDNAELMLSRELNLVGIIELGQWMRSRGEKIDYQKLNRWLNTLQLSGMASLQASVLVEFFGFTMAEIPFTKRFLAEAKSMVLKTIRSKRTVEEWHFHQHNSGFVVNNSKQFRRNMRRSFQFMHISPVLAISSLGYNFIHSLKEIEE